MAVVPAKFFNDLVWYHEQILVVDLRPTLLGQLLL